jgi:hypothetical protein
MPELLAGYRWLVHAMGRGGYEPFGRIVVEAWAAGCQLAVGEDTGALWWIENDPGALDDPAGRFWQHVDELAAVAA